MDISIPDGFIAPNTPAGFILPAPPYPEESGRVSTMLSKFRQRCRARRSRFGPRLSAYERTHIGRSDEIAEVLAQRYNISVRYVHDLRRRARKEDSEPQK